MLAHLLLSLPSVCAYLLFCRGSGVAKNQPKTLIPSSKNQIFHKFLTYFPKTSYERRATKNGYIFVSKAQVALIIEAYLFFASARHGQKAQPINLEAKRKPLRGMNHEL